MPEVWREIAAVRDHLRGLGAARAHEDRGLRLWLHAMAQDGGRRRIEDFLPRALREALPALSAELAGLARIASRHPARDGSERVLVELADGQAIESVLLPEGGLCVSTQVGCAVGCVFCMTGRGGLSRQLGSAEIAAQVALARGLRPVRRAVFMGMGEPAHNLDAVLEAIDLLGTAGGIGHKSLVLSTVGDARLFERLLSLRVGDVRPALAISLHSTQAAKRAELLPRAPRIAPAALVESGERYARAAGHPIQYQWTLIEGVNDGDDEVEGIAALLADARERRMPLAIEPLHPMYAADRACINTLEQALDVCDALDPPVPDGTGRQVRSGALGVAVDLYHVWWDPKLAAQIARAGRERLLALHVCDWLTPTTDLLEDRGMMGDGVIDIPRVRAWVEAQGYAGYSEVEIFSATNWWQRDGGEVLDTCIERHRRCV